MVRDVVVFAYVAAFMLILVSVLIVPLVQSEVITAQLVHAPPTLMFRDPLLLVGTLPLIIAVVLSVIVPLTPDPTAVIWPTYVVAVAPVA
jgi:hypothetical protein